MNIKSILILALKVLALTIVFFISFLVGSSIFSPVDPLGMTPEEMNMAPIMLLVVGLIDTLILTWLILRSRLYGWRLMVVVAFILYGVKTFTSIVEAWYFMTSVTSEMALRLLLQTVPLVLIFPPVAVLVLGKAKKQDEADETPNTRLVMPTGQLMLKVTFLSVVVYSLLFFGAGYYIAFRNPELLAYYGTSDPGSFLAQLGVLWAIDPFVFVLEFLRGALWVALAAPIIRWTKGRTWETGLLVALTFALVQNDIHLVPQPLMPPSVRLSHFIETASSNFIWGLAIVWLLHREHTSFRDLFSFGRAKETDAIPVSSSATTS
ncbi:MAG: hypothetical protein AMJ56_10845 [Anaerolineae bacterium SG8_19]|jgi:hypothetical protein|nr:MAG: hypothetical protein AMJ56_10845 [Anaerolineae bacterium SG8_19]